MTALQLKTLRGHLGLPLADVGQMCSVGGIVETANTILGYERGDLPVPSNVTRIMGPQLSWIGKV